MALIDPAIVKVLVDTLLDGVNAATVQAVYRAGEGVGRGVDRWARMVAIDLETLPSDRDNGGGEEPDHAAVTITINTFCSAAAMKNKSGALASVNAEIRRVLHRATLRHEGTTHQIDITETRVIDDAEPDENRRIATGAVIAMGTVTRQAGESMTAFV